MSLGSLIVRIGADISALRSDTASASKSLGSLEGAASSLGGILKALGVAAAATGLAAMVKHSLEAIDSSAKLSRQLGGTIDGLKGLQLAATDAGVDSGVLTGAMERLNVALGDAAHKGSGKAFEALQRLGLSARELARVDVDERMAVIADRTRELGLSTQATADVLRGLGIRQGEVTRLMLDGGEAIRAARGEVEALGLSLSEVDAAKVEAANDAMDRVKLAATSIGQRLAVHLAPMIELISQKLIGIAKDAGGFRSAVDSAVEFAIKAIGFLGNVVHGLHIAFKTVELAVWAVATAVNAVATGGAEAISALIDTIIVQVNELIVALNVLPGMDITPIGLTSESSFMDGLRGFNESVQDTTIEIRNDLMALANEEWPSDKAAAFFAEIQAAAQAAAVETVNARNQMMGISEGQAQGGEDKETAKLREKLATQLEALREHVMTEEELLNAKHAQRLEQLDQAYMAELVSAKQFFALEEDLERGHMEDLKKLREKGMERVQEVSVSSMLGGVQQLTGLFERLTGEAAKNNRQMFEVHKGFAIADALISAAAGIAQTLGAYPYPYNLAMAIPHAAVAAAQVAAIASQSFQGGGSVKAPAPPSAGGGGGGRAGGGGVPGGPVAGGGVQSGPQQLVQIGLQGDTFSRGTVVSLIESINEAISDGARLVVT